MKKLFVTFAMLLGSGSAAYAAAPETAANLAGACCAALGACCELALACCA